MTVNLYEDFNDPVGAFHYDGYDVGQLITLSGQMHTDIRSFERTITVPFVMYELDLETIGDIEGLPMSYFESGKVLQAGEGWTTGTIGAQSDRANFHGLSLTCPIGITTTTSFIETDDNVETVALVGDYIALALPVYPLSHIDPNNSFIDFTSGDFTNGPTVSLAFSSASSTSNAGDTQLTFPITALSAINTSAITGVRFRIKANSLCTFRCLAIRCLSNSWKYAPVDKNTLYDRLQLTVPPIGAPPGGYTFPTSVLTPSDWPVLFFSDPIEEDPTPVDSETGVVIHTGAGASTNTLSLYLRESPLLLNTQAELDTQTMDQLILLGGQPDEVVAPGAFAAANMHDLDVQRMSVIDADTQEELETVRRVSTRFLKVTLQWGATQSLTVSNELGVQYTFSTIGLAGQEDYYFLVTLVDTSVRAQIYPLSPEGYISWDSIVYDTTAIINQSFVYRRPGRLGWYAQLNDGDTYLKALRPRYLTHNEYRSLPLGSETPAEGAQIFVGATPDIELYDGAVATDGATLTPDFTQSNSGNCLKVVATGNDALQGFLSAPMRFENLQESYLSFDLMAPVGLNFQALLIGEGRFILVWDSFVQDNRWHHFTIQLDEIGLLYQPGVYSLALIQGVTKPSTWYVDNLSVPTRSVTWRGRQAADPWLMRNPNWVPFGSTVNQPHDGILFDRGKQIQVSGRGLTQSATIDSLQILPKYAQLGNFAWTDQTTPAPSISTGSTPPTNEFDAEFALDMSGTTITVDGRTSYSPNGILTYYWSFGDGTFALGSQVEHTYTIAGVYTVTLTVVDRLGFTTSASRSTGAVAFGFGSLPLAFTRGANVISHGNVSLPLVFTL